VSGMGKQVKKFEGLKVEGLKGWRRFRNIKCRNAAAYNPRAKVVETCFNGFGDEFVNDGLDTVENFLDEMAGI